MCNILMCNDFKLIIFNRVKIFNKSTILLEKQKRKNLKQLYFLNARLKYLKCESLFTLISISF